MKYAVILSAFLLAGCVHEVPKIAAPKHHHVAKPAPKPVAVAPAPQVAPIPKETLRQRGKRALHWFLKDRAAH